MAKLYKPNAYSIEVSGVVGGNSVAITSEDFVSTSAAWMIKTIVWGSIAWLSATKKTFASDNVTVALEQCLFNPIKDGMEFELVIDGVADYTDIGKFYDINTDGEMDVLTESATTGQFLLSKVENGVAIVTVANA